MKWTEGKQYEKAPTGSHPARCYALIDLGTQPHTYQGETRMSRDVRISFELPLAKMSGKFDPEQKGRPFAVHLTAKQSLHPKATLRRYLEGWRGKKFDSESAAAFDAKKLIGLPCRLNLVENGDFVNIDSIAPLTKEEAKTMPKLVNEPVFFSLEPDEFDEEVFKTLSERTRAKIAATPEYKSLVGDAPEPDHAPEAAAEDVDTESDPF